MSHQRIRLQPVSDWVWLMFAIFDPAQMEAMKYAKKELKGQMKTLKIDEVEVHSSKLRITCLLLEDRTESVCAHFRTGF